MTKENTLIRKNAFRVNGLILIALLFYINLLSACILEKGVKKVSDMNPHEKGAWMMSIYNGQYADYQAQVKQGNLSDDQKQILRTKKDLLTKVYPMIKMYNSYIESGSLPGSEIDKTIIDVLNRLLQL